MSFTLGDLEKIVRDAAPLFLDEARLRVEIKGKNDFVTEVDKGVQHFVKERLKALAPQVLFMGEEEGEGEYFADKEMFILDPVDGTTNLIFDLQLSSISLAYSRNGEICMGIVYIPYRDELFSAEKGKGAFLNGRPIRVSEATELSEVIAAVGTSPYYSWLNEKTADMVKTLFISCIDVRRLGSASVDLAYVACGRFGVFAELLLKPWDFAAGRLLVTEAGGIFTDMMGNPVPTGEPSSVLAAASGVHQKAVEVLK